MNYLNQMVITYQPAQKVLVKERTSESNHLIVNQLNNAHGN